MARRVKVAIISRDYKHYGKYLAAIDAEVDVIACSDQASAEVLTYAEVLLSEPDLAASFIEQCRSLQWLQSTWAGNNKLQACAKYDYILTGVKGIFAERMREYVFAYLLYFSRQIEEYRKLQGQQQWKQLPTQCLAGKTLGIMGLGNIGLSLARLATAFDMKVLGLRRQAQALQSYECFSSEQKLQFAKHCDFIVNLLPDTEHTCGLVDEDFFKAMRKEAVFINAGRGSVIRHKEDLLQALDKRQLKAAVLDVFEHEPLPSNDPFYKHENIIITNHSAAISDPEKVFAVFSDNLQRYLNQQALHYVHDFSRGY